MTVGSGEALLWWPQCRARSPTKVSDPYLGGVLFVDHLGDAMIRHSRLSGLTCLAYNTSKSALLQMCRSAAAEWGAYGIRVNVSTSTTITESYVTRPLMIRPFHQGTFGRP